METRSSVVRWAVGPAIACLVLLIFGTLGTCAADAQGPSATVVGDPYPLRPPDASSPRDTLRSFLEHTNHAIAAQQRGAIDARAFRNFVNAVDTLDFSTTPHSESFSVQIERVLLLKELLDRIALPPAGEIPGDAEVAAHGITRWTIPDSRITIARIEEGERAGEFVFSANTVERLDTYYRIAKGLPYKATGATPGAYELFSKSGSFEEPLRNRLQRIDASSPRSTVAGFLDSINEADALVKDTTARLRADPSSMTKQEVHDVESRALNLARRALDLLDLSQLPEAYREDFGIVAVLQLKEVLDRTLLPFLKAIPNAEMVREAKKRAGIQAAPSGEGYRWRYPNTEIEIVEITKGERRGQFLFSAETVKRAGEFYRKVRDLPYRSELGSSSDRPYEWTGESRGLYDDYISSPGYLLPQAHFMGRLVDRLPAPFKVLYWGQTLWQWIGVVVCILATVLVGVAVFRLTKHVASRLKSPLDAWAMLLAPILGVFAVYQALRMVDIAINITGDTFQVVTAVGEGAAAILAVWAVFRLAHAIAETVVAGPKLRGGTHDASLVRIGARILALFAGALIIIYSLRHLGADMVPLLAGLGVGGLAVALAAQRTFANFIGSLILFVNRPIKVGDFCRYGDQVGTVEQIGFLATRIRSLERTIVTVPNAEFSEMKIDNFAVRDQRLLKTVLQLRYETTPEQLRYVLVKLRELLLGHPKVTPAPARVRFINYGAYSKDVEVFAYLDCEDQDTFLAIQEDILLRMEVIVNDAGSGFAFPSQTAYFARDKGLDTRRQGEAEAAVGRWRGRGRLPFPEFDGDERRRLEDGLDYPPRGSPDYRPSKSAYAAPRVPAGLTLSPDDIVDLPALAATLRGKHPLASYLHDRFTAETRELLSAYDGGRDPELKDALVRGLNGVILGASIYDEHRFADVTLREEAANLLAGNPEGESLARLNRLLLEDAFPKEFAVKSESP